MYKKVNLAVIKVLLSDKNKTQPKVSSSESMLWTITEWTVLIENTISDHEWISLTQIFVSQYDCRHLKANSPTEFEPFSLYMDKNVLIPMKIRNGSLL